MVSEMNEEMGMEMKEIKRGEGCKRTKKVIKVGDSLGPISGSCVTQK